MMLRKLLLILLLPVFVVGCERDDSLHVFAAASTREAVLDAAERFEADNGIDIVTHFDGTSRLARQIQNGVDADVFVTADPRWMDAVSVRSRAQVASNQLVLAGVSSFDQVGEDDKIAMADPGVPAGRYAREAMKSMGLDRRFDGQVVYAGNVRGALEWARSGQTRAAFVYRTDAELAGLPHIIIDSKHHRPITYEAAVVHGARSPEVARRFVDFLTKSDAFERRGFGTDESEREGDLPEREIDVWAAIWLSVQVALWSIAVGALPATVAGYVLARFHFVGKSIISTLLYVPLVLPPVVTGLLMLWLLSPRGLLGEFLTGLSISVPMSTVGATIAATVVGFPLFVSGARAAFEAVDPAYEEMAMSLGKTRLQTIREIVMPLALPGLVGGAFLAFARALGEFGATIVLAGNVPGETQTIALAVFTLLEGQGSDDSLLILVGASIAISLLALVGYEALSRWQKQRLELDHV